MGNLKYIYMKEVDEACFARDAAYSDRKDLAMKTISDKIVKETAQIIDISSKNDGYHRGLASMVSKFFDKKKGSLPRASVTRI